MSKRRLLLAIFVCGIWFAIASAGFAESADQIAPIQSAVGEPPRIELVGPDPFTNECHSAFVDSGVRITDAPISIAAAIAHSIGLKADGSVVAWGLGQMGQTNIPTDLGRVVAIAANGYYSLALNADGSVVAWGYGPNGETNIPAGATHDVVAIAAGGYHGLALKADGSVVGWGANASGQTNIPSTAVDVISIAAGRLHSIALKSDGTVVGWGFNDYGQTNVPPSVTNIVAIAAGDHHNLALKSNGTVVTWGYDDQFHLLRVPARATNVIAIAARDFFSVALRADGSVVVWGLDYNGHVTVIPASATNIVGIAAGGESYNDFCLAWKSDGSVVGWGENYWGQATAPSGLSSLDLPFSVTGSVNTNVPGTYTLTYTATNILGDVGTTTRTVVVVDTTPPSLRCPTNLIVEWADINGAPVFFAAQATDLCSGPVSVSFDSASGSTFPIGTNTVWCIATDDSGNSSQCSFTVTVEAGQAVKRKLLAELEDFKKLQPRKVIRLNRAIAQLNQSLKTNFWMDETHLQPAKGTKVFVAEARVVHQLLHWKKQKGVIDDARLQDWIDRLVRVDRLLALGQIEDARSAGATDKRFARVLKHFQAGDEAAIKQKYVAAILRYGCAWRLATHVIEDSSK